MPWLCSYYNWQDPLGSTAFQVSNQLVPYQFARFIALVILMRAAQSHAFSMLTQASGRCNGIGYVCVHLILTTKLMVPNCSNWCTDPVTMLLVRTCVQLYLHAVADGPRGAAIRRPIRTIISATRLVFAVLDSLTGTVNLLKLKETRMGPPLWSATALICWIPLLATTRLAFHANTHTHSGYGQGSVEIRPDSLEAVFYDLALLRPLCFSMWPHFPIYTIILCLRLRTPSSTTL